MLADEQRGVVSVDPQISATRVIGMPCDDESSVVTYKSAKALGIHFADAHGGVAKLPVRLSERCHGSAEVATLKEQFASRLQSLLCFSSSSLSPQIKDMAPLHCKEHTARLMLQGIGGKRKRQAMLFSALIAQRGATIADALMTSGSW